MAEPVRWEGEERPVRVLAGPVTLEGDLSLPRGARGVVLFAHGSGSSRRSPRNRLVAGLLNEAKLATLLLDLLTPQEEAIDLQTAHLRFDIPLLATRLIGATDWLARHPDTRALRFGYFGASTGAAGPALERVRASTLLVVGGNDFPVIEMNQAALAQLRCEKRLVIVPGATHLFEEPGALLEVARLAREWFDRHLMSAAVHATKAGTP
jgi:pimeloyl-ACP methyl ester carboxylesterase